MSGVPKVLIVDDETNIRELLVWILAREGYKCRTAENGLQALEMLRSEEFDLLITDVRMPKMDGIQLIEKALELQPNIAILLMTAYPELDTAVKALKMGAFDYIVKPFAIREIEHLLFSVRRALDIRRTKLENIEYQRNLERMVKERTDQLRKLFFKSITSLAQALEARDRWTRGHSKRVAEISVKIGEEIGLSREDLEQLNLAGQLHDIGKIGIPDEILRKPGPLTPEEFCVVKEHPEIGYQILKPLFEERPGLESGSDINVLEVILHHHERFDGTGYPSGLKGEEIPLGSRILLVADAYEAMTSDRPYRKALPLKRAIEEIRRNAGTQFDPQIAELFIWMCSKGKI